MNWAKQRQLHNHLNRKSGNYFNELSGINDKQKLIYCRLRQSMKYFWNIFLLATFFSANGQMKINDTLFVSRDTSHGIYRAVFLEHNTQSEYYNRLTNFTFDNYDSLSYLESITHLFDKKPATFRKVKLPAAFPRKWCALHTYKNNFYLYAPSDWGNNWNLMFNDSTIVQYFMDGPYAYAIDSFATVDERTFEFSVLCAYRTITSITVHILDWKKQIAIFDNHSEGDEYRYSLMVGASKAREFPILVNYCQDQKQVEFKFDSTNYRELLKKKKW